jgi:hypothetical protein
MIPAQWLPSLPPASGDGWLPVYYEVSEASGILCQGEYRVDGDRVWARSTTGSVRFLSREKGLADGPLLGGCCTCWITGCDRPPRRCLAAP